VRSVPVVWRASIITGNRAGGLVRSVPVVWRAGGAGASLACRWCDPCRWSGAPMVARSMPVVVLPMVARSVPVVWCDPNQTAPQPVYTGDCIYNPPLHHRFRFFSSLAIFS